MGRNHAGISVVVASFNGSEHIAEQLTSIAGQTLAPLEIIVSDDRSTDATVERVREFAARSSVPVVLIQSQHQLGYPENFLRAALSARGELIAFSDQASTGTVKTWWTTWPFWSASGIVTVT